MTKIQILEHLVGVINRLQGHESLPEYSTIGAYYLDGAYGGYALYRWVNHSGAVEDVFQKGHVSKDLLENLLRAYIKGLEDSQKKERE